MAARDRSAASGRVRARVRPGSWVCAVAGLVGLASCLNPHPDDEPTFNDGPAKEGPTDVVPGADLTCQDNPLLAGCPSTPVPPPAIGAGSSGEGGSSGGNTSEAGSAGADAGPADAGAWDAGPIDATPGAADAG